MNTVARQRSNAECALMQNAPFTQTFMSAVSPGMVAATLNNQHYSSDEDYLLAFGRALSVECHAIVARGLLLQIDAPDLAADRSEVQLKGVEIEKGRCSLPG